MKTLISVFSFLGLLWIFVELALAYILDVDCFHFAYMGISCAEKENIAALLIALLIVFLFKKNREEKKIEDHLI